MEADNQAFLTLVADFFEITRVSGIFSLLSYKIKR